MYHHTNENYRLFILEDNRNTIKISSLKDFQKLQNLHVSTAIECPCTKISFNRSTFHQMEPIFHQVCSSDFINNDWLNILFTNYQNQNPSVMCHLTKQAVIDAQDFFLNTQVISTYMLDYDIFTG